MQIQKNDRRNQTRKYGHRSGTTLVEFAVVSPLIFLLILGGLELTALNFARQTAGNASYEAARKMIVPGGTAAQAQAEGLRQMNMVGIGAGAAVVITSTTTSVTATVSVPARNVSWGLVRFSEGYTLKQSCTLTKE